MRSYARTLASFFLRLSYRVRVCVPGNAVSSSFVNFPIPVDRTLLSRRPAIIIAVIINFTYRESTEGILSVVVVSLAIAFALLLVVFSSCVGIHADVTILPLTLSSRTVSYISRRLACPDCCLGLLSARSAPRLRERIVICLLTVNAGKL